MSENKRTFDQEDLENSYVEGVRTAWRELLSTALRELGYFGTEAEHIKWIIERTSTVNTLRTVCEEFGDNNWKDDLCLSDVVDKHLARYLGDNTIDPSILRGLGTFADVALTEGQDGGEDAKAALKWLQKVSNWRPENQVNDFGLRHEDDTCPAKDTQKDTDTVSLAKRLSTLLKAARAYLYDHQDTEVASLEAATQALNDINVTLGCDCEECESDDIAEAAIEFDALRLKYAQLKKLYDVRMEVTQQSVYKAKYSMECAESKARGLQQENAELKKILERVRQFACDVDRCESSEILVLLTDGLYP